MNLIRWKVLLNPTYEIPISKLIVPMSIGYSSNAVLFHSGDLLKFIVLKKYFEIEIDKCVGSLFVEKFLDFSILIVFFVLVLLSNIELVNLIIPSANYITFAFLSLFLFTFIILLFYPTAILNVFKFTSSRFTLLSKVTKNLENFLTYFKNIDTKSLIYCVLLAILSNIFMIASIYYIAEGFHLLLKLQDVTTVFVANSLSITLSPAPSGTGLWHYFSQYLLVHIYKTDYSAALSFAILTHSLYLLTKVSLGFTIFIPRLKK